MWSVDCNASHSCIHTGGVRLPYSVSDGNERTRHGWYRIKLLATADFYCISSKPLLLGHDKMCCGVDLRGGLLLVSF